MRRPKKLDPRRGRASSASSPLALVLGVVRRVAPRPVVHRRARSARCCTSLVPTAVWLWCRGSCPASECPWWALIPGAVALRRRRRVAARASPCTGSRTSIATKSDTYGALGTSLALLFWAYVLGRLIVASAHAERGALEQLRSRAHPEAAHATGIAPSDRRAGRAGRARVRRLLCGRRQMIVVGTDGPGSAERTRLGFEQRVDAVAGAVQRREDVARRCAGSTCDLLAVARHATIGAGLEVRAADLEAAERETAGRRRRRGRRRAPSGGRRRTRTARRHAARGAPGGTAGRRRRPPAARRRRTRGRSSRRGGTRGRRRRPGATRRAPRAGRRARDRSERASRARRSRSRARPAART